MDLSELPETRLDALLFGETHGRVVMTTTELDAVKAIERAKLMGVPARRIGTVGGDELKLKTAGGETACKVVGLHDRISRAATLTLACLQARVLLVNHVQSATATNHLTMTITRFQRFERTDNFHNLGLPNWRPLASSFDYGRGS